MKQVSQMLQQFEVPKVAKVRQFFNSDTIDNKKQTVLSLLREEIDDIQPSQKIAITCGSRGIDGYVEVLKGIVQYVKECGAVPILVPAMGSHGGATAEGQKKLLAKYGITSEVIGAEIVSSMETIQIGVTNRGLGVYIDKNAYEADGIIVFNRVKPHTSFRGKIESGLIKMLAIGLAKQKGAEATHFLRYENMAKNICDVGQIALDNLNIVCGVSTIENGYNQLSEIHISKKEEFFIKEEELLAKAWKKMPRIALSDIDVLIVNKMGKDISGTGMDTNIVGRFHTNAASGGPNTIKLGICDITDKSEGNANGMGIADFITKKMHKKIDFESTYLNTLTSTEPASSRMPMVLENDEELIKAAVKLCGVVDSKEIKLVIIDSTKELEVVYMSEKAYTSCDSEVELLSSFEHVEFDEEGNISMFEK